MSPSQQPYSEEETAVFSKFTPPVACKLKKPLVSQSTSSMLFKKHVSSETAKTATPDLSDKIFLHATTPQVVDMRSPQVEEESSDDIFKSEQSQSDLLDESEMIALFQLKMRHHA
jgi:type II secretory pathway component HofQ